MIWPVAKMANGSMRDALGLLDRLISTGNEPLTAGLLEEFLGCPNSEKIYNLVAEIGKSSAAGVLSVAEDLINTGLSETQIVDSLIDCMRDLMVAKSAGSESGLLILTSEQRKRAGELAEKFDVAALIYNITTLEKLRWTIKNSDTARALLEASLLRLALSEHFLNVDTLLTSLQTGAGGSIKKKQVDPANTTARPRAQSGGPKTVERSDLPVLDDLESIRNHWQDFLNRLEPGTAGLLSSAEPGRFEDGLLTLTFGLPAAKKMCESNGRTEQIQSLLQACCRKTVSLKFEVAGDGEKRPKTVSARSEISSQRRNEIISDPAVRIVKTGLGATVIRVEELDTDKTTEV